MKTFKLKDLMVSLEEQKGEFANPFGCPNFSQCVLHTTATFCHFGRTYWCLWGCTYRYSPICQWGCTIIHTPCPYGTIIDCRHGSVIGCIATPIDTVKPFDEAELKQLKASMAELQKTVDEQLKPQNLQDLNEIEAKLNEALAEIKKQKAGLK